MRFPRLAKAAAIGAVALVLTIALQMVAGVVDERQGRLQEAQRSVAASLADAQRLVGPVLQRACTETWTTTTGEGKSGQTTTEQRSFALALAPQQLAIDADAALDPRRRGIFRVNGYLARTKLSADWPAPDALQPPAPQHAGGRVQCDDPVLFVAVGDARGIRQATVSVGGQALEVRPGTPDVRYAHGFHVALPASALRGGAAALATEVRVELAGTESIAFAPIGSQNDVQLRSDWPHPSFGGRFLPDERSVDASGFRARWRLSALATTAQRALLESPAACGAGVAGEHCVESFGAEFIDPVSPYVLSDRATKYGLLFVVLTFVAVALVEVLRRLRVHPVQYGLVGCALVVFFLLLVSLTEHLPFAAAYLAAASACTLLLGIYGRFVLRSVPGGAAFAAGIATMYGALYVLLQLEQMALVLGAVLLFAVLAAVMLVTRRLDWYALGSSTPA